MFGLLERRGEGRRLAFSTALAALLAVSLGWCVKTTQALAAGPRVFVNEIHYDNVGEDRDEGIEVAGPAGVALSAYSLELYSGYDQRRYATIPLTGSLPDQENGFGTKFFPIAGLQNGAPDGIALVDAEAVEETLGYEGTFTAIDGTAAGLVFADIEQFEAPSTPVGRSLQLQGTGTAPADFSWHGPIAATVNEVNEGQHFPPTPVAPENTSAPAISGTALPGQLLSCSNGAWAGAPTSLAYQWNQDGVAIAEATSPTYTAQPADAGHTLTCTVTASNSAGSSSRTSDAAEVPEPMLASIGSPLRRTPVRPATPIDLVQAFDEAGASFEPHETAHTMTPVQIRTLLARQLGAAGPSVGRLLKYGVLSVYFGIPAPATLVVHWYQRRLSPKLATTAKLVVVASGRVRYERAGAALVQMRLTAAGRALLRHASRLSLTASATLTPTREPAISTSMAFALGRRR